MGCGQVIDETTMESVAEEILREILLSLPTRDAARCCCVSRLWCGVVTDPTFRALHARARHVVAGAGTEALLVSEIRDPGKSVEVRVYNINSPKPICRVLGLADGYQRANACNGFLLLASGVKNWPVLVSNPVTSEKLEVPPPPKINFIDDYWHMYGMGFSPAVHEFKLFRFSFPFGSEEDNNHLDVYTLGDGRGWRRHPILFPYAAVNGLHSPPPVFVDGKLYLVVQRHRSPNRILVIDVASEAHCTYRVPYQHTTSQAIAVHASEMHGRLWIAIRDGRELDFWIMPPLGPHLHDQDDDRLPHWELRYNFYIDDMDIHEINKRNQPSTAWFSEGDGMLCYRLGDHLYKYDTNKNKNKA
ncbi:unnamed protein product [Triticum turgidum subsp. durum]|uniref:F-box domain-containing protein n=1 Tax=Triticum turgidum subsp. durum TaxID=4567 RepID=A0A9R1QWP9_TRITD|nr:unnamed protein product [Triticum turgidum subsp. durum]